MTRELSDVAADLGLKPGDLDFYGSSKAKLALSLLTRPLSGEQARYVVISGMTPTPLGEGKTVTALGLAEAMCRMGHKAIATIRQPSLGPTFGIKGGGAGGGKACVVPVEDVNLHLTGDEHAVSAAHNLLAALLDNSLYHGNHLDIDPGAVSWTRVSDVSDRALRSVLFQTGKGASRQGSFEITAASEVMSILALANGFADLRSRLGRTIVATDKEGRPIRADTLHAAGAMTALLRDALRPNLLSTNEGTPVLIHSGPFGNISTGNSSVIADQVAVRLADYVITEAGFGTDLGLEKLCDIKSRASGLVPDAVVVVCTLRAIKMQSGLYRIRAGRMLDPKLTREDTEAVALGLVNLEKHIENVARHFGLPAVVCINRFGDESATELAMVKERALAAGALACEESEVWQKGGEGGFALAAAVERACSASADFRPLYNLEESIQDKAEAVCTKVYGSDGVDFSDLAQRQIARMEEWGLASLPICIAKTALSLSDNEQLLGRPEGFRFQVREARPAAGAGFVVLYAGEIQTMPGLPSEPRASLITVDDEGRIAGLS